MMKFSSATARVFSPVLVSVLLAASLAASPATARPAGDLAPPPNVSLAEVEAGDTLEGLLRELGFQGQGLVEIVLGFSTALDPSRLKPGYEIEVVWSDREARQAERVVLRMGDESIQLDTSGIFRSSKTNQQMAWADRAVDLTIEGTLVQSIESAGAPSGLGLDIAGALGGVVDFRRDVKGGETVEVLYREALLPDGDPAGQVELRYALIEIGGRKLELAREGEPGGPVHVYEAGKPLRQNAAPVAGARVSSHFGTRKHPVLGVVRMHTGVDYAAATGTPVFASAAGTVTHVGSSGGYGNLVEIRHDSELTTRYAHLSQYAKGLKVGQRVEAGERIGDVGATGLATGPHLHYEVRYAGKPVDPLSDEHVAVLQGPVAPDDAEQVLETLRYAAAVAPRAKQAQKPGA